MSTGTLLVNKKLLSALDDDTKKDILDRYYSLLRSEDLEPFSNEELEKIIDTGLHHIYVSCCLFCGENVVFRAPTERFNKAIPKYCENCGRLDPYTKLYEGRDRVTSLHTLKVIAKETKLDIDKHIAKDFDYILKLNCIKEESTLLEVYLKDIYATLKCINPNKPLNKDFDDFFKDMKNQCLKIKNIKQNFKKIAPKICSYLTYEEWTKIHELFQKRHVIIHNSGYIDKDYLDNTSNYPCKYTNSNSLGSPISVSDTEINEYEYIIFKLGKELNDFVNDEVLKNINERLKNNTSTFNLEGKIIP